MGIGRDGKNVHQSLTGGRPESIKWKMMTTSYYIYALSYCGMISTTNINCYVYSKYKLIWSQ